MAITWRPVKNLQEGDVFNATLAPTAGIFSADGFDRRIDGYIYDKFEVEKIVSSDGKFNLVEGIATVSTMTKPTRVHVYLKAEQIVGVLEIRKPGPED